MKKEKNYIVKMNIITSKVSEDFKNLINDYMEEKEEKKKEKEGEKKSKNQENNERKYKQFRQRYDEAIKIYNELYRINMYDVDDSKRKELDSCFTKHVVDGKNVEFVVENMKIFLMNRRIQKSGLLKL